MRRHEAIIAPVRSGDAIAFRIVYPGGETSLPVRFTSRDPVRAVRVTRERDLGLVLRWATRNPSVCSLRRRGASGQEQMVDVHTDGGGKSHLAVLGGASLPDGLALNLAEDPRGGATVVREVSLGPGRILGETLAQYTPYGQAKKILKPGYMAAARPIDVTVVVDRETEDLLATIDAARVSARRILASASPLEVRADLFRSLQACRLLSVWAKAPFLERRLGRVTEDCDLFCPVRPMTGTAFAEAARVAGWTYEYPVSTLFRLVNVEEEHVRSIARVLEDFLETPEYRGRHAVPFRLPPPSREAKALRLVVRVANLRECAMLQLTVGDELPVFVFGQPCAVGYTAQAWLAKGGAARKIKDIEEITAVAYVSVDLPVDAAPRGQGTLVVEAFALTSVSLHLPAVRSLHMMWI